MKTLAEAASPPEPVPTPGVHASSRGFTLDGPQRCPFCHDSVRAGELLVACPGCRTLYHDECHHGACATLGCDERRDSTPARGSRRGRFGRRFWALLALFCLGGAAAVGGLIEVYEQQTYMCPRGKDRPSPAQPLAPAPIFVQRTQPVWIELSEQPVWSPASDYRLRGALRGQGEVEVVVQLNGREVIRYRAHAPAPLDVLLPLRSGRNAVTVTAAPSSGQGVPGYLSTILVGH